jgi:chromosome partitioning protein
MCNERTRLFRDAMNLLKEYYGDKIKIFGTRIPNTVKIGEANYASLSVLEYKNGSKAALAYTAFAKEVSGDGS